VTTTEPATFPPESTNSPASPRRSGSIPPSPTAAYQTRGRTETNTSTSASSITGMIRRASLSLMNSDPPPGFLAASAQTIAQAPSLADIRRGSFSHDGWTQEKQLEHRRSSAASVGRGPMSRTSSGFSATSAGRGVKRQDTDPIPRLAEEPDANTSALGDAIRVGAKTSIETSENPEASNSQEGYEDLTKIPWKTSWAISFKAFFKWVITPLGFFITIYGLNVVAWGGMLFLLLCNASPAMCKPSCNDINSPRRIWIEIDSQILNALFCVTGFGLIPWRFRDLYWLMVYRLGIKGRSEEQRMIGLRRLAGIHRGWFRLPGSDKEPENHYADDESNPTVPLPVEKKLTPPLTGVRAPPTALWRMDYVIWMNCWNTFLQACLCGFMWGYNR
jgi:hypothetical protein